MTERLSEAVLALTRQLLLRRTRSTRPAARPRAIAHRWAALLEEAGFATRLVELAPGRPNLIARIAGSDADAPALGFTGHLDVVPLGEAAWRVRPVRRRDGRRPAVRPRLVRHEGRRRGHGGGRLPRSPVTARPARGHRAGAHRGRGDRLRRRARDRRASRARWVGSGALVVGEPTGLVPRASGHRGVIWVRLRFRGRTAHASMPHEGDNAVLKAARAAIVLAEHDFGGVRPSGAGLRRRSMSAGSKGGLNLNSVPDSAVLGIDICAPCPDRAASRAGGAGAPAARGRGRAAVGLPALVERAAGDWLA